MSRKELPTNSEIEAVIRAATSGVTITGQPLKDTRTQLFVGNLPYRVRWQDLKDLFRSHLPSTPSSSGTTSPPSSSNPTSPSLLSIPSTSAQQSASTTNPILRADVSLGPDNRSRGYGTVLMSNKEDAYRAVERLNGFCWQGRVLEVRIDRVIGTGGGSPMPTPPIPGTGSQSASSHNFGATGGQEDFYRASGAQGAGFVPPDSIRNLGKSLIVANLPPSVQWQELKDLFRSAGTIVRADIAPAPQLPSASTFSPFTPRELDPPPLKTTTTLWGSVTYASTLDRERAISVFDGWEWRGHKLVIKPLEDVMNDPKVSSTLLASSSIPSPATSSRPPNTLALDHGTANALSTGIGASGSRRVESSSSNPGGVANMDVLLSVLRSNTSASPGYSNTRSHSPGRHTMSTYRSFQSPRSPTHEQTRPMSSAFTSDTPSSSSLTGSFLSTRSASPLSGSSLGRSIAKNNLERNMHEFFGSGGNGLFLSSVGDGEQGHKSHPGSKGGTPFTPGGSGVGHSLPRSRSRQSPISRRERRSPNMNLYEDDAYANVDTRSSSRSGSSGSSLGDTPQTALKKERQPLELDVELSSSLARDRSRSRESFTVDLTDPSSSSVIQTRQTAPRHDPRPTPTRGRQEGRRSHFHPARPGPITLPPSTVLPFPEPGQMIPVTTPPIPSPYGYPHISPLHSPLHHPAMGHPVQQPLPHTTVPLGLPPLTPSMPSFSFLPPSVHTPTYHPQILSPGMMNTPNASGMMAVINMSGAFTSVADHPSALGSITPTGRTGGSESYFEQPIEYFPPMPPPNLEQSVSNQNSSPLARELTESKDNRRPGSTSDISTTESELDLNFARTGSSVATTVDEDEDKGKDQDDSAPPIDEMESMSLEKAKSENKKEQDSHRENLTRSWSVDENMLQPNDSNPSTIGSSPEEESVSSVKTDCGKSAIPSSSTAASNSGKPKVRQKPHPTFQASEFASIVSGFQGIVPPHLQGGEERTAESGTALTPGHGRRASWTPGTEFSSYM